MSHAQQNPATVTTAEAAKMLAVSERTLFNLRKKGQLRASKLGRSVRFLVDDLMDLLDRTKEAEDGKPV